MILCIPRWLMYNCIQVCVYMLTLYNKLLDSYFFSNLFLVANDREVTAILKLLTYTANNIPGVYFHGNSAAVLPIICRILPFFAEPSFWYGLFLG